MNSDNLSMFNIEDMSCKKAAKNENRTPMPVSDSLNKRCHVNKNMMYSFVARKKISPAFGQMASSGLIIEVSSSSNTISKPLVSSYSGKF